MKYLVCVMVVGLMLCFGAASFSMAQESPKAGASESFPNQPSKADSCPVKGPCDNGNCAQGSCRRGDGFMGRGPVRRFIRDRRPVRRLFGRVFGRRGCCN